MHSSKVAQISGQVLASLFLVALGYVIHGFFHFPYFEIDPKVNLVHLLTIFTTIGMGVLVAVIISRNTEKKKFIREFSIARIHELINLTLRFQDNVLASGSSYSKIAAEIKQYNRQLKTTFELLSVAETNIGGHTAKTVRNDYLKKIDKHLTDSIPLSVEEQQDTGQAVRVIDGIVKYSPSHIDRAATLFDDLRKHLFSLILIVNRS